MFEVAIQWPQINMDTQNDAMFERGNILKAIVFDIYVNFREGVPPQGTNPYPTIGQGKSSGKVPAGRGYASSLEGTYYIVYIYIYI